MSLGSQNASGDSAEAWRWSKSRPFAMLSNANRQEFADRRVWLMRRVGGTRDALLSSSNHGDVPHLSHLAAELSGP